MPAPELAIAQLRIHPGTDLPGRLLIWELNCNISNNGARSVNLEYSFLEGVKRVDG